MSVNEQEQVSHAALATVSEVLVDDPLMASAAMPYHHVVYPLGFPTNIKSNDSSVIRAAEANWGMFSQRFRHPPIELRFLVSDAPSRRKPPVPVFRAQANLLSIVADAHNYACCDLAAGFAFACLTKAASTNRDYLSMHFLDAMVYTLLDTQYLVAIHAACLALDGHGVLLVGVSGAGKSSFAYACARRGWTYVSDDATSLVLHRAGRSVLGKPQSIRFRPSASALFPEIQGTIHSRNGKPSIEIKTETLRHIHTAQECTIDYIVFLERQTAEPEPVRLHRLSREEAFCRLVANPWPPELSIQEQRIAAIDRLLEAQAYRLTYKTFDPAIDLLEATIRRGKS